ncbi:LysR family transcriptional regulator [Bordetella genomosp. 4]|uniref:LysR family transcriptional regulator n=1 Tax=Bordetella genomosp. 4 TaxID=463044 RepID=A0A261U423_9BORD|nr:LysR family transcriptional regulator [Bordetella genomosp. 4]OZI56311.1 LysR family transcriptional regulator [Bordetella genomosp. 4]
MREINLDQLRTLVTIADQGSFAKAAALLHLAPPTVSLHISELEQRVGAQLLSRAKGHVRPTAIGESLIDHARKLLADVTHALDDVSRQAQGLAGRVRLGASTGVIAHLLPRALASLAQSHPAIDVQIAVLTSQQTLAQLSDGSLDIGIVALPQSKVAGLTIQPWRRDPVVAFLPAAWRAPAHITPRWMAERPLILNDPGTHLSRLTTQWFAKVGLRPVPRIALNYNDAIKSLVGAGYGGTLLPHEAGAPAPDERILMRPLRPALWRQLGVAYREQLSEPVTRHMLAALWDLQQQ